MNLIEAGYLARSLMKQHGLADWTFKFDHARRRFGSCQPTRRTITLSRTLTQLNGLDEVRDTILHEIAHALTPRDGHGRRWKQVCKQIGARPVRCYSDAQVVSPPRKAARYALGCLACNWWIDRRRLTRRTLVCRKCRGKVIYRDNATGRRFIIEVNGRAAHLRMLDGAEARS